MLVWWPRGERVAPHLGRGAVGLAPQGAWKPLDAIHHAREYLALCQEDPVPFRMVKAHMHRVCGAWLAEHTDLRDRLNRGEGAVPVRGACVGQRGAGLGSTVPRHRSHLLCVWVVLRVRGGQALIQLVEELHERVKASGRDHPVPKLSDRALARLAKEEGKKVRLGDLRTEPPQG